MKQLTLKDICCYLPYGLKVFNTYADRVEELISCNKEMVTTFGRLQTISDEYDYSLIKPIIRPLSDLTKEITHKGETFVPIIELYKYSNEYYNDETKIDYDFIDSWGAGKILKVFHNSEKEVYTEFIYSKFSFIKTKKINKGDYNFGLFLPHAISYESVIYNQGILHILLQEWMFDINGLIESGLAIDLNTLDQNPY